MHYGSQQNQKIKTYREIEGEGNLNEIFNETEALEMAEARPQMRHKYPNGVYYVIKNRESSNYPITNYGNILKTLLGDELTFTGMYLNPEELFKTFNMKYNDVFQSAYNSDKDAWQILIEQLQSIKKSKNDDETNYDLNQKLQEALVRCLEKDIDIELQKSDTDLGLLNRKIIQFRREALNGDDKSVRSEIKHFTILKSLKQRIELAYEEQQTGIEVEQESRDKSDNDEQTKTKSVERWTERPVIKKVNGYRNVADKWSTPSTINGEKHSAVDKWARPVETPKRKIDAADKWKIQSHLRDGKDSSSDTSKSGPGITQKMGQTPYQIEAEKRKQELCFSAVKRAITQAKITEQEVNNETLQIKEREELEILKKKGFAKTTEERARYTYLKSKYEPQVQRQQKRQSKGQSR
ncbi:MAG: hypothetical protein J6D03_11225 [Clostridia bacterium]|nr:hypothetical protein [Clostridia bacterium]